jgi:hypothetical protein
MVISIWENVEERKCKEKKIMKRETEERTKGK